MKKSLTSYDILNVTDNATQADIHASYKRLAKAWHPDRHQNSNRARAHKNFQMLQAAYNDIKTPAARSNYNHKLAILKRSVMTQQNKVLNDNSPLNKFFDVLEGLFGVQGKR